MAGASFFMPSEQTEVQELIADTVAALNKDFALGDDINPHRVWDSLVGVGVHGVLLADAVDAGTGIAEIATIAEELGKGLNAETFIWGAVAVPGLLRSVSESAANDALGPRIDQGELPTLVMHDSSGDLDAIGRSIVISTEAGQDFARGSGHFIPYGPQADIIVLIASDAHGLVLAEALDNSLIQWSEHDALDLRTPVADANFDHVPVRVIGRLEGEILDRLALALFCQAAAMVGSAQVALADAVEYSRVRKQFGVPIAEFQAVSHRLAEALVEVELMRSSLLHAARDGGALSMLLSSHHSMLASVGVARANIQVNGGIGFTFEHTAHRHYRYAFTGRQTICSLESLERHLMRRLIARRGA